jgi:phosphomannomutase
MRHLKIGTSSVRGVVGESLTPELIVDFASAFGAYCDGGTVVIGRDTRGSSAMLRAATLASLLAAGCQVLDLGVAPTPLVSFAVRELQAAGGLSITGSHNDSRWNALKFLGPDGALLNAVNTEELLDIYHARDFIRTPWDALGAWEPAPDDLLPRYLDRLLAALDVEAIEAARFRVAIDFCNGATEPVMRAFLDALGCTLLPLNEEPNSVFAHAPAPTAANMRQLAALMKHLTVDLGAAINIDGDRIGFLTAAGEPLTEEHTLPLVAAHVLGKTPGPVVTNLSTSRMIDAVAAQYAQPVIRTVIGEGHVMSRALSERAAIAGEGSGALAVLPVATAFDAFLALGLVLEAMATTGATLAELAGRLPQYHSRKGTLACPPDLVYHVLEGFHDHYRRAHLDLTEGVRAAWHDGWIHVRASNTEPLLRIVAEADTEARAEEIFENAMTFANRTAFVNVR